MKSETKQCQNCKKDFTIEPEDFNFYEKIKVPAPTWCPECRLIRRWNFINTWSLYWRNCDSCKGRTMSMYPPEDKIKVYCPKCWWGDTWDGTEYAMDYNPARPFLEQVRELSEKTPFVALESLYTSLKNSDYSNALAWSKNCYQIFWADYCENVYYSSILNNAKDTADSLRIWNSELCYESEGQSRCYRVFYSKECEACTDVWFSRNCYSCINCVGCVNLRGASYKIWNIQYTKEEYFEKLKEFKLNTRSGITKVKKEAEIFWEKLPHRVYTGNTFNLNVTGEYVYGSKNSKDLYMCSGVENSKFCQIISVNPAKDCMDYSGWGNNATLMYESVQVGENVNNIKFSFYCNPDLFNLEYCLWNTAGKNNFGCANLKRRSYCILNKQYTKEEYESLVPKIKKQMEEMPYIDKKGRIYKYGEFFPPEMSKFSYNKSNAMRFFPKTKEQALVEGYSWVDKVDSLYEITLRADLLPETLEETNENILSEVIGCASCNRGYKITKGEFGLLHKMNLPVPSECPKCREKARFDKLQMPGLYNRECMKCGKEIRTSYAPDRPEIVYCEKCYQAEFL